jgi:hypothetical protein
VFPKQHQNPFKQLNDLQWSHHTVLEGHKLLLIFVESLIFLVDDHHETRDVVNNVLGDLPEIFEPLVVWIDQVLLVFLEVVKKAIL